MTRRLQQPAVLLQCQIAGSNSCRSFFFLVCFQCHVSSRHGSIREMFEMGIGGKWVGWSGGYLSWQTRLGFRSTLTPYRSTPDLLCTWGKTTDELPQTIYESGSGAMAYECRGIHHQSSVFTVYRIYWCHCRLERLFCHPIYMLSPIEMSRHFHINLRFSILKTLWIFKNHFPGDIYRKVAQHFAFMCQYDTRSKIKKNEKSGAEMRKLPLFDMILP